jgi:hypothetical protein
MQPPNARRQFTADMKPWLLCMDITIGAVVVHSSTHDKRRHKRIDRMLAQKRKERESTCKQINAQAFFCHADAEKAADQLCKAAAGSYHQLQWHIKKVDKYPRGRPAAGKQRIPIGHEYILEITIEEDQSACRACALKPVVLFCSPI